MGPSFEGFLGSSSFVVLSCQWNAKQYYINSRRLHFNKWSIEVGEFEMSRKLDSQPILHIRIPSPAIYRLKILLVQPSGMIRCFVVDRMPDGPCNFWRVSKCYDTRSHHFTAPSRLGRSLRFVGILSYAKMMSLPRPVDHTSGTKCLVRKHSVRASRPINMKKPNHSIAFKKFNGSSTNFTYLDSISYMTRTSAPFGQLMLSSSL